MPVNIEEEKRQIVADVRDLLHEMAVTRSKIKAGREQAEEIKSGMVASEAVTKLEAELKTARENLRLALMGKQQYNDLMENVADEKLKLSDQQEMLSQHIVLYSKQFDERQIEVNNQGDAREVILIGKLGKEEKYQTNLFAPGTTLSVGGGPEIPLDKIKKGSS